MKTFQYGATVLEPPALAPDVVESFRAAIEAAGAVDLRVDRDEEFATVMFRFDAANEREAMKLGSEITLSALAGHTAIRWVSGGVMSWPPDS